MIHLWICRVDHILENANSFILFFYPYLPNPSARAGYDIRSILKRSLTGLNSPTLVASPEEPSLPYYFPIAEGRIIGFIPFPRVLVLCEVQSVSSRIWTRIAVSISYEDNNYTTGTSFLSKPSASFINGWIFLQSQIT